MMVLQYLLVIVLILTGYFSPIMLAVLIGLKNLPAVWKMFSQPKPAERPASYPADAWPLWFVSGAFLHNRLYGMMFLLGLVLSLFIHL
jgi:1,4-dihydroxy-2-naphthoate polyprenyltransferase